MGLKSSGPDISKKDLIKLSLAVNTKWKTIMYKHLIKHSITALLFLSLFSAHSSFAASNEKVVFETSQGKIVLELFEDKAPITVKNFLKYVDSGFYNGTIFHRVIPNFVIQGGGFNIKMDKKVTNPAIKNESKNGLANKRGTLSMARTADPDSATSQFFINLRKNTNLDYRAGQMGYAVFAQVTEGLDIVDKIAALPTGKVSHYSDVPKTPIIVTSAHRVKSKENKSDSKAKPKS